MASIRKRTWKSGDEVRTAWVADYFDQAGKRHIKTFAKKGDAQAWLDETKIEVKKGVHTPANKSITIAEAGERWIEQGRADGLEASTLMQYRQHLDYHIKPFIGGVKLAEFAPPSVQSFRNRLLREKRSRDMVKKVVVSLGAVIANAMGNGDVARNVVREQSDEHKRRQRRIEQREEKHLEVGVDIPTIEEIRAILAAAQGRARPLIVTAIFTGLRASELRGLRWDDVDLTGGKLTVRQRADRFNTIGSPKSKSGKREVDLVPLVINTLKEWKLACPNGELGLVFPNGEGNVEWLPNIHRRVLGPIEVAAGICTDRNNPKYGLHSFRHAAASLFIQEGWDAKRVQVAMGHGSIQITFDTYGHLFPSQDNAEAMARLQARVVG